MNKKIFLILSIFVSNTLLAQPKQEIDSLHNVLATSIEDSARVMALVRLSFYETDPPLRFQLVNEALNLTRKIKFEKGEAQCFQQLGNHFSRMADYPKALEYLFKSLAIRERLQDPEGLSTSKSSIGNVYCNQGNYKTGLVYLFEAVAALKKVASPNASRWPNLYSYIAGAYYQQNILDSALNYYNRSNEAAMSTNSKFQLSGSLTGLGDVHAAMGNFDISLSYFRKSISNCLEINNIQVLSYTYLHLSNLFTKKGDTDSAIYYAQQSLTIAQDKQFRKIFSDAAKQLAGLYEMSNDKEALRYYKLTMDAKDSIFSVSNTAQIQSMTFTEQERQREIESAGVKSKEERNHNLQYAAIAVGLITFIILFLALSRSIIVKKKFIEFFAILGLLALFEFINLFIHPYLANITNHSPVLMLIILIAIGALLIPLHHKLEKWITNVMTEKNKKIRLAAAKKTIATLEPASAKASAGKGE